MGFYGNILTTDLTIQSQLQDIVQTIAGLKEGYKNQNFIFDGNNSINIDNTTIPDYSAADFEQRLIALEQLLPEICDALGWIYTELTQTRNLLATAQEIEELQQRSDNL